MTEWLTKDERMQMHQMREDYIEIFHTRPELREENPKLWHSVIDQWEALKFKLAEDEHEKCMSTATYTLDDKRSEVMRENLHEIRNIQDAMYQLQDAVEKFDAPCASGRLRHSTDVEIAEEMYHIAKELTLCIASLTSKGDE